MITNEQDSRKTITNHKVPRYLGYEDVFEPIVRKITGAQQGRVMAGCDFENEVFMIKPHYFGGCRCEYGKKFKEFSKDNHHSIQCFQSYKEEVDEAFKKHPKYSYALPLKTERINLLKSYCVKFGIKFKGKDLDNICTCDFNMKWETFGYQHDEMCPVVSPNFWYKKDDLKVWWYKVFFRNAYANQKLTIERFKEVVMNCMNSIPITMPQT